MAKRGAGIRVQVGECLDGVGVSGGTVWQRKKAKEEAKKLNSLLDFEGDLEGAMARVGMAKREFYKWLSKGGIADKLLKVAPVLGAKCLSEVVAMADGRGCRKGGEVKLKANMELLRAFFPLVSKDIDFDSATRRQTLANQAYLAGRYMTMREQVKVMARDPFVDYEEAIRRERIGESIDVTESGGGEQGGLPQLPVRQVESDSRTDPDWTGDK